MSRDPIAVNFEKLLQDKGECTNILINASLHNDLTPQLL